MTEVKEPPVSEVHPELFHYTNLKALENMLATGTLWATHAGHLNDSSEFELMWDRVTPRLASYIVEAVRSERDLFSEHQKIIDDLGGLENVAGRDADLLVQIIRSEMFKFSVPFVACFTTHKKNFDRRNGLLSQWRGYGEGGAAVVFDSKELEDRLKREEERFHNSICSLAEVVYYKKRLDIEKRFPDLFSTLKRLPSYVVEMSRQETKGQKALTSAIVELLPAVGRLKHRGFKEERECRAIVGFPHPSRFEAIAKLLPGQKEFKVFCFRPGRCNLIPYVKLFEGMGDLPISRILIGPSRDQDTNLARAKKMLKELAPGCDIELEKSEIPFVSTV